MDINRTPLPRMGEAGRGLVKRGKILNNRLRINDF
jgi:hypothetical protein